LSRAPRDGHRASAHVRADDRDAGGFRRDAKKSLGQNFLHERGVIEKILLAVDPRPGDRIVEIGPGQGALTLPLLDRHGTLTAIEFDRDLLAPLAAAAAAADVVAIVTAHPGLDYAELAAAAPLVVDFRGVTRDLGADNVVLL
jgi:16S rRNA (adenine1518-N6/adenine1519-N6)-dimethyltransferase